MSEIVASFGSTWFTSNTPQSVRLLQFESASSMKACGNVVKQERGPCLGCVCVAAAL